MAKGIQQLTKGSRIIIGTILFSIITILMILLAAILMRRGLLDPEWIGGIGTFITGSSSFLSVLIIRKQENQNRAILTGMCAAAWCIWILIWNMILYQNITYLFFKDAACVAVGCIAACLIKNPSNSTKKNYRKMKQMRHI